MESSRRDLHNALLCTALQSQFFCQKLPTFSLNFAKSGKISFFKSLFLSKFYRIFRKNVILEQCKGVHCVDLGESFPTHIYLQNFVSIQPRTSLVKFAAPALLRAPRGGAGASRIARCLGLELGAREKRSRPGRGSSRPGLNPRPHRREEAHEKKGILYVSFQILSLLSVVHQISPRSNQYALSLE